MYYNHVYNKYNMYTSSLCQAGTGVGLRGSATWPCVHSRRSRAIILSFLLFLITLNDFKIKINSDKFQKILINCKNHNFQNKTPNSFKFILLDQKLNNLSL